MNQALQLLTSKNPFESYILSTIHVKHINIYAQLALDTKLIKHHIAVTEMHNKVFW